MDLGHLLQEAGCNYRIFDLGRRVCEIPPLDFAQFEQGQHPWVLPLRQHAWFAIAFWDKHSTEQQHSPFLWFLQLPLDEQGQLLQVARDHFVRQVLTVLGTPKPEVLTQADPQQQQALSQSPFIRKPDAHRMAVLHSLLRQSAASAAEKTLVQLADNWQATSLQAIADLLTNGQPEQLARLAELLCSLPAEARENLLGLLEFQPLDPALQAPLLAGLEQARAQGQRPLVLAYLRVLLGTPTANTPQLLRQLLSSELATDVEFLATVAARGWPTLAAEPALCWHYLDMLKQHPEHSELHQALYQELQSLVPLRKLLGN